jgi:hypothetical protein
MAGTPGVWRMRLTLSEGWDPPRLRPVVPNVDLHRCPVCNRAGLPILTDISESQYWVRCIECGFEGRFPAGTLSISRVRRWIAFEGRRWRNSPYDIPRPRLSRAAYGAEVGGSSGGD